MSIENYGSYQLIKRLATGGMAQIYLARQQGPEGFEKLIVVKRILPHLGENADFVQMFLDEARIAARLNHPNVVHIFDLGKLDDSYFIAMEYIHGEDVRRVWKHAEALGKTIPVPLVCRIIMDACAGLDYAHKKTDQAGKPLGIVHRDISPQNILVTFEGGVKVVDFGIAKAADQATVTRSGVLKGKYSYMSPEQASGRRLDCRSDIFALGIVLHELLTGHRLFKRANDIQTLHAVTECEVSPPSAINPRLPADLDAVVMKALARNPADRYQEAIHLQMALEDWLIAHKLPSSSAHLAAFMKEIYAERLAEERKAGQVLVEELDGPARGMEEDQLSPPPSQSHSTSHGGSPRGRSSVDGRLPAPPGRLTERSMAAVGGPEPEPTTAERPARRASQSQEGVFRELIKSATVDPGVAPVEGGATLSGGATDSHPDDDDDPNTVPVPQVQSRGPAPRRAEDTLIGPDATGDAEVSRTFSFTSDSAVPTASASTGNRRRGWRPPPVAVAILASSLVAGAVASYLLLGSGKLPPLGIARPSISATFTVHTEPDGASVQLDGKPWPDSTPCVLTNVPPGPHQLVVRREGYREHREQLSVPADGAFSLPLIQLEPEAKPPAPEPSKPDAGVPVEPGAAAAVPGAGADAGTASARSVELTIRAEPEASLYVDGTFKGDTPVTLVREPHSRVEVRLEHVGYRPVVQKFEVGEVAREELIHLSLLPRPPKQPKGRPTGKVRFVVKKTWADVSCGSYKLGTTPFGDVDLPAGTHECLFTNSDSGQTRTQIIEVKANTVTRVLIDF